MSPRTVLTLADSGGIDLLAPQAPDYSGFEWAAEHLAKEKRYNGATPDVEYSVAQHSVLCADAAQEIYGDSIVAAYCLIHDVHEAVLKDDTTPKKRAIAEEAQAKLGVLADDILKVFNAITDRHDAAIHEAAGLPWPPAPEISSKIKQIDLLLFVTEWRDLMPGFAHPDWKPYEGIAPLQKTIAPWDWEHSKDAFLARARKLLPAMRPVESAA